MGKLIIKDNKIVGVDTGTQSIQFKGPKDNFNPNPSPVSQNTVEKPKPELPPSTVTGTTAEKYAKNLILPGTFGMEPGAGIINQQLRGIYEGQTASPEALATAYAANYGNALGQIGRPTSQQIAQAGLENPAATLGASVAGAIPDIGVKAGAGIATGIVAANLGTGGLATPVIAAGAALTAAISIVANLKSEEMQNVKVQYKSFTASQRNIKAIITAVNGRALDPIEGVRMYNEELARIDSQERNLKMLSERDWLSKGKDELVQIESFNRVTRGQTGIMLRNAIINPDPTLVLNFPIDETLSEEQ